MKVIHGDEWKNQPETSVITNPMFTNLSVGSKLAFVHPQRTDIAIATVVDFDMDAIRFKWNDGNETQWFFADPKRDWAFIRTIAGNPEIKIVDKPVVTA